MHKKSMRVLNMHTYSVTPQLFYRPSVGRSEVERRTPKSNSIYLKQIVAFESLQSILNLNNAVTLPPLVTAGRIHCLCTGQICNCQQTAEELPSRSSRAANTRKCPPAACQQGFPAVGCWRMYSEIVLTDRITGFMSGTEHLDQSLV